MCPEGIQANAVAGPCAEAKAEAKGGGGSTAPVTFTVKVSHGHFAAQWNITETATGATVKTLDPFIIGPDSLSHQEIHSFPEGAYTATLTFLPPAKCAPETRQFSVSCKKGIPPIP
jgi:hypothetical protein